MPAAAATSADAPAGRRRGDACSPRRRLARRPPVPRRRSAAVERPPVGPAGRARVLAEARGWPRRPAGPASTCVHHLGGTVPLRAGVAGGRDDPRPPAAAPPRALLPGQAALPARPCCRRRSARPGSSSAVSEFTARRRASSASASPRDRIRGRAARRRPDAAGRRPTDDRPGCAARYRLGRPLVRVPGDHLAPQEPRSPWCGRSARRGGRPDVTLVLTGGAGPSRGRGAGRDPSGSASTTGCAGPAGSRARDLDALYRGAAAVAFPSTVRGLRPAGRSRRWPGAAR